MPPSVPALSRWPPALVPAPRGIRLAVTAGCHNPQLQRRSVPKCASSCRRSNMSSRGRSMTPAEGNHVATRHARRRRDNFARRTQCNSAALHKKTWKALLGVSTCPLVTHADSAELMASGLTSVPAGRPLSRPRRGCCWSRTPCPACRRCRRYHCGSGSLGCGTRRSP